MKKNIVLITILALGLMLFGCTSNESAPVETAPEATDEAVTETTGETATEAPIAFDLEEANNIVGSDYLLANLENENILILDARGEDAHKKGHIPGAIPVMWQQFSDMSSAPGDANWGTVLPAEALTEALQAIGVTADKEIIVYTDALNGWGEDARIVWMLNMAGHENANILDGGYNYWTELGYETTKEASKITAGDFVAEDLNSGLTIDTAALSGNYENYIIIDTRTAEEFEGAQKYGEARGGHLPNAINIPFTDFLNDNGTLKTQSEIETIMNDNGITKDDKIVTYCTAGIRSAHMQVVLEMAGYDSVNYDESFYRWAGSEELEIQ